MRIRRALATAAAAAALAGGLAATPATADNSGEITTEPATTYPSGEISAAAWYESTALGGPIRECYAASCDPLYQTDYGHPISWSHYAYNSAGNRWYYVRYTPGATNPNTVYGWLYCGNIAEPC